MINIEGLTKLYGSKIAVEDVSFEVKKGEVLGFLGPNGAGKTTTMKIITSFMPPTSGRVTVMNYDTMKDSMRSRRCIGYLPENTPLYKDMRVKTFLQFVAGVKGVNRAQMKSSIRKVISEFGLESVENAVIGRLSKGFRQRVGLAQALVNDPPVLILDEPTLGLDPRQIHDIRQLIKDLSGSRTIILSSHILPEVSQLCDRVAIINKGRIVAIDSTQSLKSRLQDHADITVKVGDKLDTAVTIIERLVGVLSVSISNSSILNIKTIKDRDLRPVMAQMIVSAGIPLLEIVRKDMSLEDIFMELVTEEPRADA
ncbi:MAG TPA: ATP-binding cassette domain-containing protein [Deltaproteobacteria bacterium]|nr:ATP-binding cassette domain-containing protein [Deltaproteobacteria bacterium]